MIETIIHDHVKSEFPDIHTIADDLGVVIDISIHTRILLNNGEDHAELVDYTNHDTIKLNYADPNLLPIISKFISDNQLLK